MMHVTITCAENAASMGRFCDMLQEELTPDQLGEWVERALRENGWHAEDGKHYCPRHNPTKRGAPVRLAAEYRALGDSGWEARLPAALAASIEIEIRPVRERAR